MFIDDKGSNTSGNKATTPYVANAETTYKTGFKIAGVAGYGFDNGLGVDGELFFAGAKLDKLAFSETTAACTSLVIGGTEVPISGTAKQLGLSAAAGKDVGTDSEMVPFFGDGIGFMRADQGNVDKIKINRHRPSTVLSEPPIQVR